MKNKLPRAPKSSAKFWGLVLGIPGVLIAVLLVALFYQGSTKDIVAAADRFSPGEGWELKDERVTPPRFVCLDSVSCPSVQQVWYINRDISQDEFHTLLNKSGMNKSPTGDCIAPLNVSGTKGEVCSVSGHMGNYNVWVGLLKSVSYPNETNLRIYVE